VPRLVANGVLCRMSEVYYEGHFQDGWGAFTAATSELRSAGCPVRMTALDDEEPCGDLAQDKPYTIRG